jgi:hypothetical protein
MSDHVVLINDNRDFEAPGDVIAYSSAAAACGNVELLDIEGGLLHALRADGRRLQFTPVGDRVELTESDDVSDYLYVVRRWLWSMLPQGTLGMSPDVSVNEMLAHIKLRA